MSLLVIMDVLLKKTLILSLFLALSVSFSLTESSITIKVNRWVWVIWLFFLHRLFFESRFLGFSSVYLLIRVEFLLTIIASTFTWLFNNVIIRSKIMFEMKAILYVFARLLVIAIVQFWRFISNFGRFTLYTCHLKVYLLWRQEIHLIVLWRLLISFLLTNLKQI